MCRGVFAPVAGIPCGATRIVPGFFDRSDGGGRDAHGETLKPGTRLVCLGVGAVCWAALGAVGPAVAAVPPSAVVLLLDTSGSMTQSDPTGMRAQAAARLVVTLPPDDLVAVLGFAATPHLLLPLSPVGQALAGGGLTRALGELGASGGTDLAAALEAGTQTLSAASPPPAAAAVVLVTDGVPDVPGSQSAAYAARLDADAAAVAAHGWNLETVGLGSGVDQGLLQRLAREGDGRFWFAAEAGGLAQALDAAWAASAPAAAAPPPSPPTTVSLALTRAGLEDPTAGSVATLDLRGKNSGSAPVTLTLSGSALPTGWAAPTTLIIPPGSSTLGLPVHVGAQTGPTTLRLGLSAPGGVRLAADALSWSWRVRPRWRVWLAMHFRGLALGVVGLGLLLGLGAGYGGWLIKVRPQRRVRGALRFTGPGGEVLGQLELTGEAEVAVGAAAVPAPALAVPWVGGEDVLFRLRTELEGGRGCWLSGLVAWRRPPDIVLWAEAAWPYHLYLGSLPRRRLDVYHLTTFGVAGVNVTFHAPAERAGHEAGGVDLLREIVQEEGASPQVPSSPEDGEARAVPTEEAAGPCDTARVP